MWRDQQLTYFTDSNSGGTFVSNLGRALSLPIYKQFICSQTENANKLGWVQPRTGLHHASMLPREMGRFWVGIAQFTHQGQPEELAYRSYSSKGEGDSKILPVRPTISTCAFKTITFLLVHWSESRVLFSFWFQRRHIYAALRLG